jgi:hypothetical protein
MEKPYGKMGFIQIHNMKVYYKSSNRREIEKNTEEIIRPISSLGTSRSEIIFQKL